MYIVIKPRKIKLFIQLKINMDYYIRITNVIRIFFINGTISENWKSLGSKFNQKMYNSSYQIKYIFDAVDSSFVRFLQILISPYSHQNVEMNLFVNWLSRL